MPDIDLTLADLGNPLGNGAVAKILAVMHWPNDKAFQSVFIKNFTEKYAKDLARFYKRDVTFEGNFLRLPGDFIDPSQMLAQANPIVVHEGKGKSKGAPERDYGNIAASLLSQAFMLEDEGVGNISLTMCADRERLFIIEQCKKENRRPPMKLRAQDIEIFFQKFRPVAHLWLSHLYFFQELSALNIAPFLCLAEEARRRGEAIKHRNARLPILDPTRTWRVPDVVLAKITNCF